MGKIKSIMILKSGELLIKDRRIKDNSFDHDNGKYIIKHSARLLKKGFLSIKQAYVHIEGISEPIDVKNINSKEIKIDAKNFKELLKAKLFADLFAKPINPIDIVVIILVVLSILVSGFSAIQAIAAKDAAAANMELLIKIAETLMVAI